MEPSGGFHQATMACLAAHGTIAIAALVSIERWEPVGWPPATPIKEAVVDTIAAAALPLMDGITGCQCFLFYLQIYQVSGTMSAWDATRAPM